MRLENAYKKVWGDRWKDKWVEHFGNKWDIMGFAEDFDKYQEKGRVIAFKSRGTSAQKRRHR